MPGTAPAARTSWTIMRQAPPALAWPMLPLPATLPQYKQVFRRVFKQLMISPCPVMTSGRMEQAFLQRIKDGAETLVNPAIDQERALNEIERRLYEQDQLFPNDDRKQNKLHTARQWLYRTLDLVRTHQKVRPETLNVFLSALPHLKKLGEYNHFTVRKHALHPYNISRYERAAKKLWEEYPDDTDYRLMQHGFWCYMNKYVRLSTQEKSTHRIYIGADLERAPHELLEAWHRALRETGSIFSFEYKFGESLYPRDDFLLLFVNTGTWPFKLKDFLISFIRHCPPALLSRDNLPTGIVLRPGITLTADLGGMLEVRRLCDWGELSYNHFIISMMDLAFMLAYHDLSRKNKALPLELSEKLVNSAERYFKELILLSGFNPETMLNAADNGELPSWAQAVRDHF